MTIEERLNEIVEKGQGDAIIPFLQGLTQEERKTLVPSLQIHILPYMQPVSA